MAGMAWYQPVRSINSVAKSMNIGNRCLCTEDHGVEYYVEKHTSFMMLKLLHFHTDTL